MSEESTTPDLVELTRHAFEAASHGDINAVMSFFAPNAAFDGRGPEDLFEGRAAIRGMLGEWFDSFAEVRFQVEEFVVLDDRVVLAVVNQEARPVGTDGQVRQREGWAICWSADGLIVRLTTHADIDEASAAAERFAQERGYAMSQENVEIVRRAVAAINDRDLDGYLACCSEHVELRTPLIAGVYEGRKGIQRYFSDVEDAAPDFRIDINRVETVGPDQVLAFIRTRGTGRATGIPLAFEATNVYDLVDGQIARVRIFLDASEALKTVGLEE